MRIPLARDGIFWSIQGEGLRAGEQMAFLRIGGCSLNCAGCDTDYRVAAKATPRAIERALEGVRPKGADRVVWVTGGEPADLSPAKQDLLVCELKRRSWDVCVATNGEKAWHPPVPFISVTMHRYARLTRTWGSELKVVDMLPAMVGPWLEHVRASTSFGAYYVQPLWGDADSLGRCKRFLAEHPQWRLSLQMHKYAGVM